MDKEQVTAIVESIPMEQRFSVEQIVSAAIASYKAELLKEVGESVVIACHYSNEEVLRSREQLSLLPYGTKLYTSNQVAAAVLKATKPLDTPIDPSLADEIERTDWTPAEALQFYADQRNFDLVGGHARIIDNGATASNALKHLSIDRLELKGDAELAELRAQLAAAQEETKTVTEQKNRMWFEMQTAQNQLAKAEQRVAEACAELLFSEYLPEDAANAIRSGEYRKFMKGE